MQRELERQGHGFQIEQLKLIIQTAFYTIKDVIAEGDELRVDGLGKFYGKEMGPRVVKGGWKENGHRFEIPARKKLGFSSFGSTDRHIQRGKVRRNMDGIFADVLGD